MTYSDETLMAYVDRELDADASAAIEAAVARDPELAARVERQRKLRGAVHAAFEPILQEPMPKRLLEAASGATPVSTPARARPRWGWFEWSAMAASVVVGVLVGGTLLVDSRRAPAVDAGVDWVAEGGHLVARGPLALALSEQLAGTQKPDASVRIGLTFLSKGGEYCRTFTLEKGAAAGLACSSAGEWRIPVIAQTDRTGASGAYRTAAAPLPPAILREIDERIQGSSLDAEAERAAQQRGWKR
jgi:hypothetical protein